MFLQGFYNKMKKLTSFSIFLKYEHSCIEQIISLTLRLNSVTLKPMSLCIQKSLNQNIIILANYAIFCYTLIKASIYSTLKYFPSLLAKHFFLPLFSNTCGYQSQSRKEEKLIRHFISL